MTNTSCATVDDECAWELDGHCPVDAEYEA
jgi:hypothetical protein